MAFGHMHWNHREMSLKERRLERSERFEPYARWRRNFDGGGFHGFINGGLHGNLWAIPGNGSLGGWNQHMEGPGQGYVPTWASIEMLTDGTCQRQVPFVDGRSYRGGGQIANQRDPRGAGFRVERNSFSNMTRGLLDKACNRRPVGEWLSYHQMTPLGYTNKSSSYCLQRKDHLGKVASSGGLSIRQNLKKEHVLKDCNNKLGREMFSNTCTSPVDSVSKSCCYLPENKSLSCQSHLIDQPHRTAGASGLSSDQEYDKTSVSTVCSEREIGKVLSCDQRSPVDSANNSLSYQSHHLGELTGASAVSIEQECIKALSLTDSGEKSNSQTSSYACRTEVDHEKKSRSDQPYLKKELSKLLRNSELASGQDYKSTLGSSDWKPFKRARCGLSSGGLRFVHPGTSESTRDSDSSERNDPSLKGVKLPVQDTAEIVVSDVPPEELPSRKKQRLGWGEGLAKYEKKKVEYPSGSPYNSPVEPTKPGRRESDKRLVPAILSGCSPPATHLTSKDTEENCWTTLKACKGFSNPICYGSQDQHKDSSLRTEKWDLTSILQSHIPCSIDSGAEGYAAIDKLIGFKANILKELETTVSEIDLLEIELKSYVSGDENSRIEEAKEMCKDIEDMVADNPSFGKNIQGVYLRVINSPDQTTEVKQISAAGSPSGEKTNMSPFHVDGVEAECDNDGICKVSSGYSCTESALYFSILSSNKQAAKSASEELNGLLPKDQWSFENSLSGIFSSWQNNFSIREKLVEQKKFRKFKEMVLTIKFKILNFLWKEELLLLSKDSKRKSPKKFKSSIRIRHNEYQKWRSYLRSRFPSLENLSIAQLQGIIDYAHNLTREFHLKIRRKALQMPALILDKKEKTTSMFISSIGFIEDPCEIERERTMINLWTLEEKETFLSKFAIFGKDFNKIASFLVHKTVGDCVQFYYKHHKSDWFQSAMEKLDFTLQSVTVSSYNHQAIPLKKRKRHEAVSDLIGAVPYDKGERKKDCNASAGHGEGCQALSIRICNPGKKMRLVPDDQDEEEENYPGDGSEKRLHFSWTDEEKALFLEALSTYGKDFAMISDYVGTKSSEECIIFYSKARNCLGLDQINNNARDVQPCINYDCNGGSDSVITSATVSEMNQDCIMQVNSNKFDSLRAINSHTNLNLSDEKGVVLSESIYSKISAASVNNAQTGTVCSSEIIDSKADSMESSSMFSFETTMSLAIGSQNKLAQRSGVPVMHLSCWQEEPYGTETVDQGGAWFAAQDFSIESSGSSAADMSVCSLHRFNPETGLQAPNNTDFEKTSGVTCLQAIHPVREESAKIQHATAKDEDTLSLRRDLSLKHMPGHGFFPPIQSSEIPRVYALQKSTDAQGLTNVGGSADPSTLQSWPLNRCSTSSLMAEHPSIPKSLQKGQVCRNEPASFKLFGRILTLPPQPSQLNFDLNTCGYDLPEAQHPMSCDSSSHLEFYQRDTGIKQDEDYCLDLQLWSAQECHVDGEE